MLNSHTPNKTPILWSIPFPSDSVVTAPSFISNNLIGGYSTDEKGIGQFTIIDLEQKEMSWQSLTGQRRLGSGLAISNGTYWFVNNNKLKQLEVYSNSGQLVFVYDYTTFYETSGNPAGLSPIIYNNTLYVGFGIGLFAFDISNNPSFLWMKEFPDRLTSIAVDNTGLYVGTHDDNLNKLSLDGSETFWVSEILKGELSHANSLSIQGNRIFANSRHRTVAFNTESGQEIWISPQLSCDDHIDPGYFQVLDETSIYFHAGSCIWSVAQSDGTVNWLMSSHQVDDGLYNFTFAHGIALHNGVIYATNGHLWAIDAKTGEVLSRTFRVEWSLFSYVQIYKNQVIVWGENLIAYKPVN